MNLSLLYRGPLSSCNYACGYCPFAKRANTPAELAHDRACLDRFVGWVGGRTRDTVGVLFTPWGEALVRRWYQAALTTLTHLPHVRRAAVQTNLSCKLGWVADCDLSRLALWCTYHPGEVARDTFLSKCRDLRAAGVRFSVGVVGMKEYAAEIAAVRAALPPDVYLWVNAYKREPGYYTPEMVADLTRVDPLFPVNNTRHPSRGEACRAGASVTSSAPGTPSAIRRLAAGTVVRSLSAATTRAGTVTPGSTPVASYRNIPRVPRATTAGDCLSMYRVTNSSCPFVSVPANRLEWFDQWADPFA